MGGKFICCGSWPRMLVGWRGSVDNPVGALCPSYRLMIAYLPQTKVSCRQLQRPWSSRAPRLPSAPHIPSRSKERRNEGKRERRKYTERMGDKESERQGDRERDVDREKRRRREGSVRFAHNISTPWHPMASKSRDGPCWGTRALAVMHHNDNWISNDNNGTYEQKTQFNDSLSLCLTILQCAVSMHAGIARYYPTAFPNIGASLNRTPCLSLTLTSPITPMVGPLTTTTSLIGPATSPGCFAVM